MRRGAPIPRRHPCSEESWDSGSASSRTRSSDGRTPDPAIVTGPISDPLALESAMAMLRLNRRLAILLLAALPAAAAASLRARAPAQVNFIAQGPAGLRIEGKSSDLLVTDRPDALVVTVPLARL